MNYQELLFKCKITIELLFKCKNLLPVHEVKFMWKHITNLGRRGPGDECVLCRDYVPSRRIRLSGRAFTMTS